MTLIATFLLIISVFGWVSLLPSSAKIAIPQSFFMVMAAYGCLMMLAFILQIPLLSARLLIYGGLCILPISLLSFIYKRGYKATISHYQPIFYFVIPVILIIYLMAWGLQFSSIDDYSFWGTISRFLYVFNHLPENADFFKARFLQYTPGLASFHYLLYNIAGFYSPTLNYIAQDLILLAPILLLVDAKRIWLTLALIMVVIITLFLAYGNILAKLEVDASIALWFFALLWTASKPNRTSLWVMLFGLVYLSIIKEIGLLFSVFVIGVHYFCHRHEHGQLRQFLVLLASVLFMKMAWLYHVHQYQFASFASHITFSKAVMSLIPGNPDYTKSQILFLKGLLTSNFDHIFKMPFAAIFILAGWQIHRLSKLSRLQSQHVTLFKAFCILLPFYAINIYWLQAIVFRVGYQQPYLLDFPRYFNMAFVPFILCVLTISIETKHIVNQIIMRRWTAALSMIALIFIVGGKVERTKKYYHPFDYDTLAHIIQMETKNLDQSESICLTHVPNPDYQLLMPLQYRLMPLHIVNNNQHKWKKCGHTINFAELNR